MRQSADEFTESNKILSKDQFQHVFDDQLAVSDFIRIFFPLMFVFFFG